MSKIQLPRLDPRARESEFSQVGSRSLIKVPSNSNSQSGMGGLNYKGHFGGAVAKKRSGREGLKRTGGLAVLSALLLNSYEPISPSQIERLIKPSLAFFPALDS